MSHHDLPHGVDVSETAGGVRYTLPRRDLGSIRWIGLPLALFGGGSLVFAALAIALLIFILSASVGQGDGQALIAFGVFGVALLPTATAGAALLGVGMWLLRGNVVAEIRDGKLIVRTGWWRLRRSRRVDLADVARLAVVRLAQATSVMHAADRRFSRDPVTGELRPADQDEVRRATVDFLTESRLGRLIAPAVARGARTVVLQAEPHEGAAISCLSGYPAEIVVPVAHDLAARCGLPFDDRSAAPAHLASTVPDAMLSPRSVSGAE